LRHKKHREPDHQEEDQRRGLVERVRQRHGQADDDPEYGDARVLPRRADDRLLEKVLPKGFVER
jgi:hypothetical protein